MHILNSPNLILLYNSLSLHLQFDKIVYYNAKDDVSTTYSLLSFFFCLCFSLFVDALMFV